MGDWYENKDGRWVYDESAPAPSRDATSMMPAVTAGPPAPEDLGDFVEVYEREDGSIYGRVDPDAFEDFDQVDSRTIVDLGASYVLRGQA